MGFKNDTFHLRIFFFVVAILWSALIIAIIVHNHLNYKRELNNLIREKALSIHNKDIAFRNWATSHGGVYVPIDSLTPANPHLSHIKEQNITTPSGKQLTLMNPAYMVRQMNENFAGKDGVLGHITSLKPLRPENKPDEWERIALEKFEEGISEVSEFTLINGEEYFRFMKPFFVESSCLKCHGNQGYELGQIRGGVGVALPVESFSNLKSEKRSDFSIYVAFWLLGIIGLFFAVRNIRLKIKRITMAEQKLKLHAEQTPLGVIEWSVDFKVVGWSKSAERILGYTKEEAIGKNGNFILKEEYSTDIDKFWQKLIKNKEGFQNINKNLTKDNKTIYCEWFNTPLVDSAGKVIAVTSLVHDITETVESKKKLIINEEKYRLLFENMTAGFALHEMIYDEKGKPIDYKFLEVNPAFEKLTGAKASDLIGKTVKEVMPNTEQHWIDTYGKVATTGEPIAYENFAQELGKYFDTWSFCPTKDQFAVVFTDITERKLADLELVKAKELIEESETRFKALHNASFGGIAIHDKGIILECNLGLTELTGFTYEELIGMNGLSLISDETRPLVIEKINSGYEKEYEAIGVRKNREEYALRLEGREIPYKGKQVRVVEFRDITDRKAMEKKLEEYSEHLEFVVKERTEELEASNEELRAVNEELYDNNDKLEEYNLDLNTQQDEISQLNEELQQSNEELHTTNENQGLQAIVLEETIKNLKHTQAQLVQAEKMASLGILTAGVAHEINNPVNFITSSVYGLESFSGAFTKLMSAYNSLTIENCYDYLQKIEKLKKETDFDFKTQSLQKIIKNINEGTSRITKIVSGLRTFSIQDDDEMSISDLHENIDATLIILQHEIKNRITIEKEYGNLPKIKCFPSKLNQVFSNVIMNSIHAIEGKGIIFIKTIDLKESVEVCISIKDSGLGMSEEIKDNIFEPFFSTKKEGSGTGLGLYISYGIIEKHKGRFEIDSELGKGTEFKIFLPYNL